MPPTEHAFLLYLQHDTLATIIAKTAHAAKPQLSTVLDYGWAPENGKTSSSPINSASPATDNNTQATACDSIKGCSRNEACYIGCRCQGSDNKCSQIKCI